MAKQMMQDKASEMAATQTVPTGYQQTEVGVIPEDWDVVPFFDAISIASGQVSPLVEPYASMTLVAPDHIEARTGRLLAKESAKEQKAISGKYYFLSDDTVYSKIRPYLRKAAFVDFDGLCSADMYPLRAKSRIEPKLILPLILDERFSSYTESVSVRSGMPKINRAELADFSFALPRCKNEQAAIAIALSDSDALIESLEQLIAKKQAVKTAAMQQLLTGRTRLPQFALRPDGTPKGYKSSELGQIPEDWEIMPLGSIGRTIRGVSYNPNNDLYISDSSDSIRLFRSNNILNSRLVFSGLQYVSKNRVSESQKMQLGDILICMANGSKSLVGKSAIHDLNDGYEYTFGAFMGIFRLNDASQSKYVYYLMNSARYRCYIDLILAGSSINNLKPSDIDKLSLAFPDIEEQTAIAAMLSDMDSELAALEQKLAKARDVKQGMMQQLLTGRIRLPLEVQA